MDIFIAWLLFFICYMAGWILGQIFGYRKGWNDRDFHARNERKS